MRFSFVLLEPIEKKSPMPFKTNNSLSLLKTTAGRDVYRNVYCGFGVIAQTTSQNVILQFTYLRNNLKFSPGRKESDIILTKKK